MGSEISNYEITKRKMMATFPDYDHAQIAGKLGLKFDRDHLFLTFMGTPFRISRVSGLIEGSTDGFHNCFEANFNQAMTILDLLCYSEAGAAAAGEYTLMQSLSSVRTASTYAGHGMFECEERYLDAHSAYLERALDALGGLPFGKGDICRRLPLYGDLYIIFQFWFSDDEFPASLQLYFDKNTLHFMHFETIWYAAGELLDALNRKIELIKNSGI